MPSIEEFLTGNLPRYLDYLHQMVSINSFTANPQGVNSLGSLTADIFSNLGFQAEYVQSTDAGHGKHLFLKLHPSSIEDPSQEKTIAMISHLDTVFPPEEELQNHFSWHRVDDRICGPGVVDIKGGTVMIYMVLDALKIINPHLFNKVNWLIALDASEEVLSDDFGHLLLEKLPSHTLACLIFEGGTPAKKAFPLVIARKGRATFHVQVQGRSAHAGNNHAQGANAILQLAHLIPQIEGLTDYAKNITFNVGTISGGTVINRVPHYAKAGIEMRAFDPQVFQEGYRQMLSLENYPSITSKDGFACQVSIQAVHQTSPWPQNQDTDRLYSLWQEVAESSGLHVMREERGGLSDGNFLWNHFPTLDGLGPTGANAHCSERSADGSKVPEYARVSSFVPKALLNILAIQKLME